MTDTDRTLSSIRAQEPGAEQCDACHFSRLYCRAVVWFDGGNYCCPACSHAEVE